MSVLEISAEVLEMKQDEYIVDPSTSNADTASMYLVVFNREIIALTMASSGAKHA